MVGSGHQEALFLNVFPTESMHNYILEADFWYRNLHLRTDLYRRKMVGRLGFDPTTIGLKVRDGVIIQLIIQPLTGTPVATYAQLYAPWFLEK